MSETTECNGVSAKRKMRVLVFPCGSEIGLEVNAALRNSIHVELYGATSVESSHGPYVYHSCTTDLPMVDSPDFISRLNALIRHHEIDYVIPAHDSVVLELAEKENALAAEVIGSPAETCRICRSKRRTYEFFSDVIRTPTLIHPQDSSIQYPVFLKPDVGQGSKGIMIAHDRRELDVALNRDPTLLALELLPGEEFTVDCFTDRSGTLQFVGPRTRSRIMNGISVDTSPVAGREFESIANIINAKLEFRGVWFFQLKRAADGELALLEIGPRAAGSMAVHRCLGANLVLLSVFDRANYDVQVRANHFSIRLDRALTNAYRVGLQYSHVYIDFDDTLVIDGKVNTTAIAFLYQCRNQGIKIHLLSRHAGELEARLKHFAIAELLHDRVHITDGGPKWRYIAETDAIFIDDSFAERLAVMEKLGIPVFGVDAIECLLDRRA